MSKKIQLIYNTIPLNGYVPIDLKQYEESDFALDIENSSVTTIVATILDYIPATVVRAAITNWCKKIRLGGNIVLGGSDIVQIVKSYDMGVIDINKMNSRVYGYDSERHVGGYDCEYIARILREAGMKIIKKRTDGVRFVVEAKREKSTSEN